MSPTKHGTDRNNLWFGLIILLIGLIWLLHEMNYEVIPAWLFTWKFLLILIGLYFGFKSRFRGMGWLIPTMVGTFFFIEDVPGFDFEIRQYGFPVAIIIIGFLVVYRALVPRSRSICDGTKYKSTVKLEGPGGTVESYDKSTEDFIDLTTNFGSTKKKILSKNFKGGKITTFFGGVDLDLTQADIEGEVRIDIIQNFAGLELAVPSNWEVKTEVAMTIGGLEDNRKHVTSSTGKVLILTGTCMMGGIEINSY